MVIANFIHNICYYYLGIPVVFWKLWGIPINIQLSWEYFSGLHFKQDVYTACGYNNEGKQCTDSAKKKKKKGEPN